MTEADWLTSTDPRLLLAHLGPNRDPRRRRLWHCACCRRVWHLLADARSRRAVEVAERFADGRASAKKLRAAARAAEAAGPVGPVWEVGSLRRAVLWEEGWAERAAARAAGPLSGMCLEEGMDGWAEAELLRCIFGNPFRPAPALGPERLAWNGGALPKLAEAIYEERVFDRMGVLADALEEAGCTDPLILDHCRYGVDHGRGCFVLDAILRPRRNSGP